MNILRVSLDVIDSCHGKNSDSILVYWLIVFLTEVLQFSFFTSKMCNKYSSEWCECITQSDRLYQ